MTTILKTFGRTQSHNSEAEATTDTLRALDLEALEAVSGGKVMPPSGSTEGGGNVGPIGHRDPRFF
jgi:hypothetical protein